MTRYLNSSLPGKSSLLSKIFSVIVTLAFCGVTGMIFVTAVPDSSRDLANMLFGGLMGMQGAVVNYWIGSSSGSAVKDRKQ